MKDKFAKLIEVKTLVTFAIVGTVVYLAIKGTIEPQDIMFLAGMILTYFFNKDKKPDNP